MKLKETLRDIIREEITKVLNEDANVINSFVNDVRKNVTRGGARTKVYGIAGATTSALGIAKAASAFKGIKLMSADGPVTIKDDDEYRGIVDRMPKSELVNTAKQTLEHLSQRLTPEQFAKVLSALDMYTRKISTKNNQPTATSLSKYMSR
jgi:hypothetical protein